MWHGTAHTADQLPTPEHGSQLSFEEGLTCTDALVAADNRALRELASRGAWGRAELERRHGSAGIAVTEKAGQTAGVESHLCNEVSDTGLSTM